MNEPQLIYISNFILYYGGQKVLFLIQWRKLKRDAMKGRKADQRIPYLADGVKK